MVSKNEKFAPKVVVIGGGTGSFTLLQGLKKLTRNLTALVNMADSGGSTGVLRDELGVLPPGDVRQCLVALSESPKARDLFMYRFTEGSLAGHSFGNLFLSAVEKLTNNFSDAVELADEVLRIRGRVLPITTDNVHLVAKLANGKEVRGEYEVSLLNLTDNLRPSISLDPAANLYSEAKKAINEADLVVIAPGNLYSSLAPALVVGGVKEALEATNAKIIYVCNLVTKPGHTDNFKVNDYADEIERFVGAPVLDCIVYNTEHPAPELMEKYTHEGEHLINFDKSVQTHYRTVGLPLIDDKPVVSVEGDAISQSRSLIRHNSDAVAAKIIELHDIL